MIGALGEGSWIEEFLFWSLSLSNLGAPLYQNANYLVLTASLLESPRMFEILRDLVFGIGYGFGVRFESEDASPSSRHL